MLGSHDFTIPLRSNGNKAQVFCALGFITGLRAIKMKNEQIQ